MVDSNHTHPAPPRLGPLRPAPPKEDVVVEDVVAKKFNKGIQLLVPTYWYEYKMLPVFNSPKHWLRVEVKRLGPGTGCMRSTAMTRAVAKLFY